METWYQSLRPRVPIHSRERSRNVGLNQPAIGLHDLAVDP